MTPQFDTEAFFKALGKRLRELRKANGMTQPVFADKTGYVTQTISNIERGETTPSLMAVFIFSTVLRVHPKALLFGPEE